MKRKRLAALLTALALCAGGCARGASAPAAEMPASPGPTPSPATSSATEAAGELTFHNNLDGAAEEDGFYYLRPGAGSGSVLCRLDFASGQSAAVCAVPGCEHGGEECPAYFSCYANLPVPVLWQEQLLLIFPGNPFAGEPGDEAYLPRVELAEADGTGRRELARLAPEEQIAAGFATDDNRLYFLTSSVEQQTCQPAWTLKSVDLSTGQTDTLARYGGESMAVGYYLIGCTEEELVIKRIETTGELEPSEESVASNVHSLMLVGRQDGTPRPLRQWRQDEIAECVSDGQLFYCDGEGRLFQNALDGTEDRLAVQLPAAVQPKKHLLRRGLCALAVHHRPGRRGQHLPLVVQHPYRRGGGLVRRVRRGPAADQPGAGVGPLFQHAPRRGADPAGADGHRRPAGRQPGVSSGGLTGKNKESRTGPPRGFFVL